jgi:hypothetical protein
MHSVIFPTSDTSRKGMDNTTTGIAKGALDRKLPHASVAASGKGDNALASLDHVRREQEAIGKNERRLRQGHVGHGSDELMSLCAD